MFSPFCRLFFTFSDNKLPLQFLSSHQVPTKVPYHCYSADGQERKYNKRLMGRDKDSEKSLTSYHHGQNRLNLGKLIDFIAN